MTTKIFESISVRTFAAVQELPLCTFWQNAKLYTFPQLKAIKHYTEYIIYLL